MAEGRGWSDRYEFIGEVDRHVDHPTVSGMRERTRLYACLLCSSVIVSRRTHEDVCIEGQPTSGEEE